MKPRISMQISHVLDLYTHSEEQATPHFLALESDVPNPVRIMIFTPRVMQWSESVWLFDMTPCRHYWEVQAARHRVTVMTLLQKILNAHFEVTGDRETASFRAVAAPHPWQALLLLGHLRDRNMKGLVNRTGAFGETLHTHTPWETWFETAQQFAAHCETTGRKGFNPDRFRQRTDQMKRAVDRLGFPGPHGIAHIPVSSMQRRFGSTLADLWRWTFPVRTKTRETPHDALEGFPWIGWAPPEKPQVTRHLDYPIWLWEQIEPLLREDFDRLCALNTWSAEERVTRMHWQIVLDDFSTLLVPVAFRNPHALHADRGEHVTALSQTQYGFVQAAETIRARNRELDLPDETPMVSWKLIIEERFFLPPRIMELFEDTHTGDRYDRLLELENRLPVSLDRYVLRQDFLPEESFERRRNETEVSPSDSAQWMAGARHRPLFIYENPVQYEPDRTHCTEFIERTQVKWWQQPPSDHMNLYRDYYRITGRDQQTRWIYRDKDGNWFLHGIYS